MVYKVYNTIFLLNKKRKENKKNKNYSKNKKKQKKEKEKKSYFRLCISNTYERRPAINFKPSANRKTIFIYSIKRPISKISDSETRMLLSYMIV